MTGLKLKTVKGVAWSSVDNWGRQLLSFFVFATLARLLTPTAFGIVALAAIYVALVDVFISQGTATAIIQRNELEEEHLDSAFWLCLGLGLGLYLITVLLASPVAWVFGEPALGPVLRWLALVFLLLALAAVPTAILTRRLDFRTLALRSIVSTALGGTAGIILALQGYGVWSLVGQQLLVALSGVICLWWAVDWRPRWRFSIRHLRDLLGFALSIVANNLLWLLCQRADQTLVGFGFGATVLGPYALASRVTQLLMDSMAGPLQNVSLPAFSRLQTNRAKLQASFFKFTEVGALIAFPACFGLIILSDELVPLLFGSEWAAAGPILQVLAVYAAIRVAMTFFHPLMLAKGRPGLYLATFVLNAGGTVIGCLIAIQFSPRAVAVALVVNIVVQSMIFFRLCGEVVEVTLPHFLGIFRMPLGASATMALFVWLFRGVIVGHVSNLAVVALSVILGVVVYGLLVLFWRRDLLTEVMTLRRATTRQDQELAIRSE